MPDFGASAAVSIRCRGDLRSPVMPELKSLPIRRRSTDFVIIICAGDRRSPLQVSFIAEHDLRADDIRHYTDAAEA